MENFIVHERGAASSPLSALLEYYQQDSAGLSAELSALLGVPLSVKNVSPLGRQDAKAHGMTDTLRVEFANNRSGLTNLYIKAPNEALYGETLAADRAREITWRMEGYRQILGHSRCLCVARVGTAGQLEQVPFGPAPLIVIEEAISGQPYANRLYDLRRVTPSEGTDEAMAICRHMVANHRTVPGDQVALYRRSLRQTLMDPVFRLIDAASERWSAVPFLRRDVEHAFLDWRIHLTERSHRLRRVHLDYHPWNVFLRGTEVSTIGARLPGVGDPADDLACFLINYFWFSLRETGEFSGPHLSAFRAFNDTYRALAADPEVETVIAPFFAKRLLVLLNPAYYPDTSVAELEILFSVLRRTLDGTANFLSEPERLI